MIAAPLALTAALTAAQSAPDAGAAGSDAPSALERWPTAGRDQRLERDRALVEAIDGSITLACAGTSWWPAAPTPRERRETPRSSLAS